MRNTHSSSNRAPCIRMQMGLAKKGSRAGRSHPFIKNQIHYLLRCIGEKIRYLIGTNRSIDGPRRKYACTLYTWHYQTSYACMKSYNLCANIFNIKKGVCVWEFFFTFGIVDGDFFSRSLPIESKKGKNVQQSSRNIERDVRETC